MHSTEWIKVELYIRDTNPVYIFKARLSMIALLSHQQIFIIYNFMVLAFFTRLWICDSIDCKDCNLVKIYLVVTTP